ncbi:hypothetical protein T484DRAFT_1821817 [Baffinella frigidus]|nr:hypothetical protein T484DRAFT_1821817 [Cryptophyta sp. CCMP2293]
MSAGCTEEEEGSQAAPKKKKGPKYPAAGAKPMAPDSVIRLVHESFEAKIQADYKDDGAKRPRQDFVAFVKDFVVRKYGLKSIAMKHLGEIVRNYGLKSIAMKHLGEIAATRLSIY